MENAMVKICMWQFVYTNNNNNNNNNVNNSNNSNNINNDNNIDVAINCSISFHFVLDPAFKRKSIRCMSFFTF